MCTFACLGNNLQARVLAELEALELLSVRAVARDLRDQVESVAASLVLELNARLRSSPPPAQGVRWLQALFHVRAPPRLAAAGGYNSDWNGHEPVSQYDDGDGCLASVEVVCSFASHRSADTAGGWRKQLPPMANRRADLALVSGDEGSVLYALGGRHGGTRHASVETLDILRWSLNGEGWRPMASMSQERSGLAAGVVRGHLVAVGGRAAQGVLREVEVYNLASDNENGRWGIGCPLQEPREYAAAAVLQGQFWVLGGGEFRGSKTVDVLDAGSGMSVWQRGPDMNLARYGAAAVGHAGRLFVVGGSRHWTGRQFATMEALDPREGRWSLVQLAAPGRRHQTSLWGCSLVAHDQSLFICGGAFREAEESQDTIFRIDLRSTGLNDKDLLQEWPARLHVPRWCGGAVLI